MMNLGPGMGLMTHPYGTVAPETTTLHTTQRRLPAELDPNPIENTRRSISGQCTRF